MRRTSYAIADLKTEEVKECGQTVEGKSGLTDSCQRNKDLSPTTARN